MTQYMPYENMFDLIQNKVPLTGNWKISRPYVFFLQLQYVGLSRRHNVEKNDVQSILYGKSARESSGNTSTKYTAGIFQLRKGDKLGIMSASSQYRFARDSAYFGAFLLMPLP